MADKNFGVKRINLIGASGTPTIESPNNININAVNVAISTDMTVGGTVGISSNVTITGLVTATTFTGQLSGNLRLADNAGDVLVVGSGIGQTSQLYNTNLYDSLGRAITNVTADQVHFAGDADGLIGSPDIAVTNVTAGIITATKFAGDGSELTGVSSESLDVFVRSKSTGNIVGRSGNIALRPVAITVTSNTIDIVPRSGSDITVIV